MTVLAAHTWATNADLIADVATLHLDPDALTLDATYGLGIWWKKWRPTRLVASDLDPTKAPHLVADFTRLPYPDATFPQIAYDPPYVSVGGRQTTGIADLHGRFGLTNAPTSPAGVQHLINCGLTEMARVATPRATVLVKCQDYISSGKLWPGTHLTLTHAVDNLGFRLVDRFEHVAGVRPQPPGRRQVHSRRNLSTLFVLEAGR